MSLFIKIALGMNEGPVRIHIPASTELSCVGCKYHSERMVKSGVEPVYRHDCEHPDAEEKPMKLSFTGNIPKGGKTPKWCPFRKINKSESTDS